MFDLTNVEESKFEPLQPGEYKVSVDGAEWKVSKAGHRFLNVKLRTDENRVVFDNFNLSHPDEKVKMIAMAQLKNLMVSAGYAANKMNWNSEEALLQALDGCECNARLKIDGEYNRVTGYKPLHPGDKIKKEDIPF
jgi:hypothetical protein